VGLAAATAHRGVRHVRIPTTTLSQADSGVGVKNGINAFGKKNLSAPLRFLAVINDFEMLSSLAVRDKRAGYIEAVKVAFNPGCGVFEIIENNAANCATLIRSDAATHLPLRGVAHQSHRDLG